MVSFVKVIEACNKFDGHIDELWAFNVLDHPEPLGYMLAEFKDEMIWRHTHLRVSKQERSIHLDPPLNPGDAVAEACRAEFENLCEQNENKFKGCLQKWLQKREDYHPIRGVNCSLTGLKVPSPLRGILGVVTTGVHLTVYTVKKIRGRAVTHIWVSRRSAKKNTYASKLDQLVAGGMDPEDEMDPLKALRREAMEEAGLSVDIATRSVSKDGRYLGRFEEQSRISFYDRKDREAGGEEGHLEPGIRFTYKLRVPPDFVPVPNDEEGIDRFLLKTVDEVKADLKSFAWKPNCGLVMLEFLLMNGEIRPEEDEHYEMLERGLRRELPFKNI
ncbi:NUDIX hydrolase domain-containingprotein [Paramyrothecium foliicola]|nr:NUDIX hydrolase domain-containingprotein [Paramyrothecium foliicola]